MGLLLIISLLFNNHTNGEEDIMDAEAAVRQ